MERIFKIKTRSNPDPRGLYPSERRYSASIVAGLSVVFLQLFLYSILMGTLLVHKMSVFNGREIKNNTNSSILEDLGENSSTAYDYDERLERKVERDLLLTGDHNENTHYYNINIPALVCSGCFLMGLGSIFSATTGLLAWKRWYIDHNITFFFLSTCFSTLTSSVCLLLVLFTTINISPESMDIIQASPLSFSLSINILILSVLVFIWSILSMKVAFKGMKNTYPDDMIISKCGGRVEVNTITKGNKNCSKMPPDILNHFPASGKLAKYFPKKDNSNLPKAESNLEYQQRVNNFLSGEPENNEKQ